MSPKPGAITKKRVQHVAQLANLKVTDNEAQLYATQLEAVVEYIKQLDELDTTKVTPTFQVIDQVVNVFREDVITPSLSQKEALSQAQETHNGYFVVPAILEQ